MVAQYSFTQFHIPASPLRVVPCTDSDAVFLGGIGDCAVGFFECLLVGLYLASLGQLCVFVPIVGGELD